MSSDNSPTGALARADEKIHQQIVFLSNLRAKRNFLLPVFRLPPETFAIVFTHGARDYYESDDGGHVTPHVPTWVNVSYICHHWRNIALNYPPLWTYPFHVSPRWTEELLLRSKQAPLQISYMHPPARYAEDYVLSWFLDRFLKHSEHIQVLRLCLLPYLPAKLPLRAPHLEQLEIKVRSNYSMTSTVITDGEKPPLRILKLANCSLSWNSLNLGRLKTLSLCRVHSPSPLDIVEFLTILSGMRDLTVLHLDDVLPSVRGFLSSGGLGISPKVDLPSLARLAIVAPLSAVVALLSCVNIPLKTQLRLEPQFERGCSIDDYHLIVSFIGQRFSIYNERSSSDLTFRSLIIDCDHPKLTFSTSERDCKLRNLRSFEDWDHDIPLEVILGTNEPEEIGEAQGLTESDKHRIMSDICCSLPLTHIQSLRVIGPAELSSAIWKEILAHLDGLRYMKLSYGRMPNLSFLSLTAHEPKENLGGQGTRDQDPTRGHIFVPALEEVELHRITFIPEWEPGRSMSQKSFFDTLSTRKGLGDRLSMIECKSV